MKTRQIALATIIFGLLSSCSALAACEPFSAITPIDARYFAYSDVDGDGRVSPGDKLIGRDTLFDAEGNETGRLFVVMTLRDVADGTIATKAAVDHIYALTGGAIFAFRTLHGLTVNVQKIASNEIFDGSNMNETMNTFRTTMPVIGGTGSYAGAGGTVAFSFTDGVGKFEANVSCE
jgi:hypothetical protein